jgi:hypothetical protein
MYKACRSTCEIPPLRAFYTKQQNSDGRHNLSGDRNFCRPTFLYKIRVSCT